MNKILWHSNAPWAPSGYGVQTGLFAPRLQRAGYDVAVSAFFGLHGACLVWDDVKVYPAGYQHWGNDVVHGHATQHFKDLEDGLVISLMDVWVVDPEIARKLNWLAWMPIDHESVPPAVKAVLDNSEIIPLAMSQHGQRKLQEAGYDPLYIPHGVDTAFYHPMEDSEEARAATRRELNWPESAFVVGMVSANRGWPSRKAIPQALMAFARFLENHNDAVLYLHMEVNGTQQGMNIPAMLAELNIPPDNVRIFDPYHYVIGGNPNLLKMSYQSMDVLLIPSMGEGFGIPLIEAQACGTPVITTDCTAMTELAGAGWLVGGTPWYTEQRAFQVLPDVDQIVDALNMAYTMAPRMTGVARDFAMKYDADSLMPQWDEVIRAAADRLSVQVLEGLES